MELSFVAPGTQTHRYALQLAGLPKHAGPIDPTWIDDALTAAMRVFDAHRVHFADAYFAYRARDAAQHSARAANAAPPSRIAGDLHDDAPLLADTFAIAQLAALVSLESSGVSDVIDVRLVVLRLREEGPTPPVDGIGEVTFVAETIAGLRSARH